MKPHTLLLSIPCTLLALTACSPPDAHQETFLDSQIQALDKAKQVEKLGYDHKQQIDNLEKQAK